MKRVGEVDVYDSHIVYTSRFWDQGNGVTTTSLKYGNVEGDRFDVLAEVQGKADFNPVFADEGESVLFLSTRSGSVQLHKVDVGSGKVEQLTDFPVSINNFKYSEEGDFVLMSIDVFIDCETLECTAKRNKEVSDRGQNSWKEYDDLFVRHWDKWEDHTLSQLFIVYLDDPSKEPINVLQSYILNSPVPPFGGSEMYDISPDGKRIAFTGETADSSQAWTTGWNVYLVELVNLRPVSITGFTEARTQNPSFSPDGNTIAYLAMDRPGFEADRLHINMHNIKTGKTSQLRGDLDVSFDSIQWDSKGEYVILNGDSLGYHKLFTINVARGDFYELISTGTNAAPVMDRKVGNSFVLLRNSMMSPNDVYSFTLSNGNITQFRKVTEENAKLSEDIEFIKPEYYQYQGANTQVQGWFLPPYGWNPSMVESEAPGTFPLVVLIHGGPEGAWNDGWSYRWNPQLWSAAGFATVMFNIHGSTGFGQDFTDGVAGNWGGVPYQDLELGVESILASKGNIVDKSNVFACGASYGGFMINWLLGQEKKTFKALVVHDGMQDTRMGYYTTDELWFPEWEFKGKPWSSPKNYEIYNPERLVPNWKNPTLVIHGGMDFRLPVSQGLATFTALQRQGVPSELLYFPDENHWVLNPNNGIKWYDTVLGFLKKWTD